MAKSRKVSSEFSKIMEYYRVRKGISLNKLAATIGVSAAYLSRIKNGQRNAPSVPITMLIAVELDIPKEDLLRMLGMEEHTKDLFDLISKTEFTIYGELVDDRTKDTIINTLESIMPFIMRKIPAYE